MTAATDHARPAVSLYNHKGEKECRYLEVDRAEGCLVGRDPRTLNKEELESLGRPRMSRGDALRAKCVDCCAGSAAEVRRCGMIDCSLWPFRMGTDPYRDPRVMSDEQRAAGAERLAAARRRRSDA